MILNVLNMLLSIAGKMLLTNKDFIKNCTKIKAVHDFKEFKLIHFHQKLYELLLNVI